MTEALRRAQPLHDPPEARQPIALILTVAGFAAGAWRASRLIELGEHDAPGNIAAVVSGPVGFLCVLVLLNFR